MAPSLSFPGRGCRPLNPRFQSFQISVKAASGRLPRRGRAGGAPGAKLEPKEAGDHGGDGGATERLSGFSRKHQKVQPGTTGFTERVSGARREA